VNIGEPWPDSDAARTRVLEMQTKLHQWATDDPERRFDDLYNLVYDPAFLVVAWERVRGSRVYGDSHKDSAGGEDDRRPRAVPDHHQHADPTTTHLRRRRCSRPTDARHRCRGDSTQVTSIVHLPSTGDACDQPEVVALKVGGSSPLGHPRSER
jgi:hypothetical protein